MKVLHFILGRASLHTSNGVNKVIYGLCKYTAKAGHQVRVIGISSSSKEKFKVVDREFFKVEVYNRFNKGNFKKIQEAAQSVDIVHLHSVWNNHNIKFAKFLSKQQIPYVITVHSGLTDDRLKQSRYFLKLGYHYLLQKRIFDDASGIHAITREEITAMSKYIENDNVFCISNGIDLELPELNEPRKEKEALLVKNSKFKFGYLGRLSVEKNLDALIRAISKIEISLRERLECYLIGPVNTNEAKKLEALVQKLGLSNTILFTGGLFGHDKYDMLKSLDFYVHPALSDVVSIAVKEAMYCSLPCVITRTSDVAYYYASNSFIMVEPLDFEIARGIEEMISRKSEWPEFGANAKRLVEEVFNWEKVVPKMLHQYQKILAYD